MSGATRKPNVRWECTLSNTAVQGLSLESGTPVRWYALGTAKNRIDAYRNARAAAETDALIGMLNHGVKDVWLTWFDLYHECHMQTLSTQPHAEWTAMNSTGQKVTLKRIYTRRKL